MTAKQWQQTIDYIMAVPWPYFSTRTRNCLTKAGILSIDALTRLLEADLMNLPHFTKKCLNEVKDHLQVETDIARAQGFDVVIALKR